MFELNPNPCADEDNCILDAPEAVPRPEKRIPSPELPEETKFISLLPEAEAPWLEIAKLSSPPVLVDPKV